jgi:hypothetical protein
VRFLFIGVSFLTLVLLKQSSIPFIILFYILLSLLLDVFSSKKQKSV